jgi:hypothetical protein
MPFKAEARRLSPTQQKKQALLYWFIALRARKNAGARYRNEEVI